jgi:hypothetical protein
VDIVDNAAGLADFTYVDRAGVLRLYEAGRTYRLPWVIAHAATKPELVAKRRPANWVPPNMFQLPEVLTEAEVLCNVMPLRLSIRK